MDITERYTRYANQCTGYISSTFGGMTSFYDYRVVLFSAKWSDTVAISALLCVTINGRILQLCD